MHTREQCGGHSPAISSVLASRIFFNLVSRSHDHRSACGGHLGFLYYYANIPKYYFATLVWFNMLLITNV